MSTTSGISSNSSSRSTSTSSTVSDAYESLGTQAFLKLLVAELANQDPTAPMETADIISQIAQIRSITASDSLSKTLEAAALSQNMYTAGSLLGQTITGLDDKGKSVSGMVDQVKIADGQVKLIVGSQVVSLKNITAIQPASADADAS